MAMNLLKDRVYPLIDQTLYDIDAQLENYQKYIEAYCAELKVTECDILKDEELFQMTFGIFEKLYCRKLVV